MVGTLAALDPDPDETFTYELLDDAGGTFAIVGDTIVVAGALDFETAAAHVVTVRAMIGRQFVDKTFAIDVIDANDAPTAAADAGVAGETTSQLRCACQRHRPGPRRHRDADLHRCGGRVERQSARGWHRCGRRLLDRRWTIQFDPGALFDPLELGEAATVDVTYTMSDAQGLVSSSTLTLTIDGAAEEPIEGVAPDTIVSSLGSEVMTGGWGADTFVFQAIQSQSDDVDTITDFVVGEDYLQFEGCRSSTRRNSTSTAILCSTLF